MLPAASLTYDELLHEEVARYYADPYGFVLAMYPWGEPGPLEQETGPDIWQRAILERIGRDVADRQFDGATAVSAIRGAVSSGHGVGKSALVAWLVDWIMSTRPYCQGTITANTIKQLETKTWAAVQKWTKLCRTAPWFVVNDARLYRKGYRDSWFCAPQSSKEENSESFAGQHAKNSTSFYICDEASAIPDVIYEVAEGGLTDGEPMMFLFGNPTRSTGRFHQACFGTMRHRWAPVIVDSRTSKISNKQQIAEWIADYGLDSDFVRVRVLGLPPRASDAQFIDSQRVLDAQKRAISVLPDEPLVAGCDLAWGGADDNVIRFRRGMDARSIPPIRIKGEFTRDPQVLTTKLADLLANGVRVPNPEGGGSTTVPIAMLFLDSAGIAGPIAARLRQQGHRNVQEVNFGADSPSEKCRYFRDFMWEAMKQWLLTAAIDASPDLETDLTGPGVRPDPQQRIWLESKEQLKKRGLDSPDDADALALTFASPVRPKVVSQTSRASYPSGAHGWMSG
ncbi:MAG TPA: hypothetical protein VE714_12625 [Gemmatimonadales bacterium]|nr:hypothetical protein [Gemmatimonadales bacterium]